MLSIKLKYTIYRLLFTALILGVFVMPVSAQTDQIIKSGQTTQPITMPATGCVYKWVNDHPEIGLAASGNGNIAAFTAINDGILPIKATITATPVPVGPYGYRFTGAGFTTIDLNTLATVAVVPLPNLGLLTTSPDGNILYVITDAHTISIVNTADNKVIGTIPVAFNLKNYQTVVSADGSKMYLTDLPNHTVYVVNTVTKMAEATIPIPNMGTIQSFTTITPDGSKVYVAEVGTGNTNVISTATNTVIATIPTPAPQAITVSPDGSQVYVLSRRGAVYFINTATNAITTIPVAKPGYSIVVSPDGKYLYLNNDNSNINDYISVIEVQTGLVTTVPVGFGKVPGILSPDGKFLYIVENDTGNVTIVNTTTNQVVQIIQINATPSQSNAGYSKIQSNYDGSLLYISIQTANPQTGAFDKVFIDIISTATNTVIATVPQSVNSQPILITNSHGLCNGPPTVFTITVNPDPAIIDNPGTLASVATTYGTPSSAASILVSGSNTKAGIVATAPIGFEVSADGITYGNTATVGSVGVVAATKVYIRLKATAIVDNYTGNLVLSAGGVIINVVATGQVTAVPLTITAKTVTKTYGTTLTDSVRAINFGVTGLMNGETIGSVNMSYGVGAMATDIVKTYIGSVTPSVPMGGTFNKYNYSPINYISGDIVVTPAILTVTTDNKTKFYGEINPDLTVQYTGFVNNEDVSQLTSLPIASTTATLKSTAGQYPITITGAAAANYTFNYVAGKLTVVSKAVTIPNTFTPNGDGINDTWDIQNLGGYPNCTVDVFNRYGEKMFYSAGYPVAWAGKRNGANLPVGTYYYIIKLGNGAKPLTGYLAIIR